MESMCFQIDDCFPEECPDFQYQQDCQEMEPLIHSQQLEEVGQHTFSNFQQQITAFNQIVDQRIDGLRGKIGNLQRELSELEKLSHNPEQIERLVNTGLIDKVNFGKLHTQIVIDAEQSLSENVIRVNSINKRVLCFEGQEMLGQRARGDQASQNQLIRKDTQKRPNQHFVKSEPLNFNSHPAHQRDLKQQQSKDEKPPQRNSERGNIAISQRAPPDNDLPCYPQYPTIYQTHCKLNNNQDPFGVQQMQQHMKKDQDYLQQLNYIPPQPTDFGRPARVLSRSLHVPCPQGPGNKTLDMRKSGSSFMSRKRNKYKMLGAEIKRKAVQYAIQENPRASASRYLVPLKSLKRWMKVGCERKKGGGRKTKDPEMEKKLYSWYLHMKEKGTAVTAKMIKDRAIKLKTCPDFIASKGWLDKFKIRYRLDISKESFASTQASQVLCNNSQSYTMNNNANQSSAQCEVSNGQNTCNESSSYCLQ